MHRVLLTITGLTFLHLLRVLNSSANSDSLKSDDVFHPHVSTQLATCRWENLCNDRRTSPFLKSSVQYPSYSLRHSFLDIHRPISLGASLHIQFLIIASLIRSFLASHKIITQEGRKSKFRGVDLSQQCLYTCNDIPCMG